ncbi:TspO/MBR family protein [Streptomyces sp. Li-HN-5-11]|uniref:TspO/MBR family protein n=1 Tax=Streptomyces sp. Li-HN-5-11 TaxID=3075432 RepID=UPI0028AFEC24|nr:TspO/MBR family protein [Streptomyces sp. Li-HN-5-11]WNM29964.1 TspO/MBR family protein [Streptomyces sp. Li-HN-5-11]
MPVGGKPGSMELSGERTGIGRPSREGWRRYGVAAAAVTATAVTGARAVDADSAWYAALRKPSWQPPPWAFGAVWTPLYASIAWAAGHALGRTTTRRERTALAASLAVNLSLNAGWNWLFFARRSPVAGLADTLLLDLSNADLLRRTGRTDRAAARALIPYAAWCAFATALNASIARRNT